MYVHIVNRFLYIDRIRRYLSPLTLAQQQAYREPIPPPIHCPFQFPSPFPYPFSAAPWIDVDPVVVVGGSVVAVVVGEAAPSIDVDVDAFAPATANQHNLKSDASNVALSTPSRSFFTVYSYPNFPRDMF